MATGTSPAMVSDAPTTCDYVLLVNVRDTRCRYIYVDPGKLVEDCFDGGGGDIFAASDNHVFESDVS